MVPLATSCFEFVRRFCIKRELIKNISAGLMVQWTEAENSRRSCDCKQKQVVVVVKLLAKSPVSQRARSTETRSHSGAQGTQCLRVCTRNAAKNVRDGWKFDQRQKHGWWWRDDAGVEYSLVEGQRGAQNQSRFTHVDQASCSRTKGNERNRS